MLTRMKLFSELGAGGCVTRSCAPAIIYYIRLTLTRIVIDIDIGTIELVRWVFSSVSICSRHAYGFARSSLLGAYLTFEQTWMRAVSLLRYHTFANVCASLNKPFVLCSMITEYGTFRALVSQTLLKRFTSVGLRSYAIGSASVFQGALS